MAYVLSLNCSSIQITICLSSFVASQQALALAVDGNGRPVISYDDGDFLRAVAGLANDTVEGVRIGVARFAAAIHCNSLLGFLLRMSRAHTVG